MKFRERRKHIHKKIQVKYLLSEHALSLGVERPGREADHSPQSNAEVKE
jgi:hypothetical protein